MKAEGSCIVRRTRAPEKGTPGKSGFTYRPRGLFESGQTYVWKDLYRDVCLKEFAGKVYTFVVRVEGSSVTSAPSSSNGDASWLAANELNFIATQLIMADNAIVNLLQGNKILVKNADGSAAGGMEGGAIPLFIGGGIPEGAPFSVSALGKMKSTDAEITGKVNAESGKIGSLNIVGNALTNEGFNDDSYIILRNDNAGKESFVGIGGNMYPSTMGGARASARFECTGKNDSSNTALYLRAANASGPGAHNIAIDMQGEILTRGSNGAGYFGKTVDVDIFDGWINGIKNVRLKFLNGILVDWVNI